ncbi:MAG: hypothetical protein HY088_09800 [Ignavibacteriales bacterium]|nr:hypothetical protein [Ignavibacteriales bacterium]
MSRHEVMALPQSRQVVQDTKKRFTAENTELINEAFEKQNGMSLRGACPPVPLYGIPKNGTVGQAVPTFCVGTKSKGLKRVFDFTHPDKSGFVALRLTVFLPYGFNQ